MTSETYSYRIFFRSNKRSKNKLFLSSETLTSFTEKKTPKELKGSQPATSK